MGLPWGNNPTPSARALFLPGGRRFSLDIRFHRIAQESPAFVFLVDVGLGNSSEHAFTEGQRCSIEVAPFLWTAKPDSISGSKPVV